VSADASEYCYRFMWKNNERRAQLFGRRCKLVCSGKLGSVMVEFQDGQREVVSRRALRLIKKK
jgi:hypothetical protein